MSIKAIPFALAGLAASALMVGAGYYAGNQASSSAAVQASAPTAGLPQQQIEQIVRDYLLGNPEILAEMQVALEQRQQDMQAELQRATIAESADVIFNSKYDGVIGNPNGTTTIVEFFDYNCGFCKRAHEDMKALVANNPDLRFVLKEFPILGPDSQKAHIVSMAFRSLAPEKYQEFHERLLVGGARASEGAAILAAVSLGVDEATLRQEMKNPEIIEAFNQTYDLANRLAITGTPSYVVGDEVVFGALGHEVLSEKVDQARATN